MKITGEIERDQRFGETEKGPFTRLLINIHRGNVHFMTCSLVQDDEDDDFCTGRSSFNLIGRLIFEGLLSLPRIVSIVSDRFLKKC